MSSETKTTNQHGRGDRQWEARLHAAALRGDRDAVAELFESHKAWLWTLAVKVARPSGWELDQAFAEASAVFVEILPVFDPSRTRLVTFLGLVVPQKLRARRDRDRLIGFPNRGAMSPHNLEQAERMALVKPTGDDEPPIGLQHKACPSSVTPSDAAEAAELRDTLARSIEQLAPRDQAIVRRRYWDGETLASVGVELGVTRERARQLQNRVLEKLRKQVDEAMPEAC